MRLKIVNKYSQCYRCGSTVEKHFKNPSGISFKSPVEQTYDYNDPRFGEGTYELCTTFKVDKRTSLSRNELRHIMNM